MKLVRLFIADNGILSMISNSYMFRDSFFELKRLNFKFIN